jgi:4-amino-4-deoxychorismate lyase
VESPFRNADLTSVQLIETLLWDGTAFPRLRWHKARLAAGQAAFGWPQRDPGSALQAAVTPGTAQRVRLLADRDAFIVTTAPLPAALPEWRVRLAPARLDAGDPWLGVKSTRRTLYDTDRAALPEGVDEWIYANTRGEISEGTITSVFFDAGQGLCTPPQACGCLPGCLRAEMLAAGHCRESVLPLADLARVRLWVGNALRGLSPARLV